MNDQSRFEGRDCQKKKGNSSSLLIENGAHTIALAALAILGHKSAHSFPMGPVIADPEKNIGTGNN